MLQILLQLFVDIGQFKVFWVTMAKVVRLHNLYEITILYL